MSRSALILFFFLLIFPTAGRSAPVLLKAKQLIDGKSSTPITEGSVLVDGERILAVNPSPDQIPSGTKTIDFGSATLMPGLIDAHVHLTIHSSNYQRQRFEQSNGDLALLALHSAGALLQAGWTTVRDAGEVSREFPQFDVRRAIEAGLFPGPRIVGAGHYISTTGGGGDINFLCPCLQGSIAHGLIVDGADEMRRTVRTEIKNGADHVKLLVTGAFMSAGDNPQDVHYSAEEIMIAVTEARHRRVRTMAHAHSAQGILLAIQLGVDTIEHGTFIDEARIEAALKAGTPIIPTLYVGEYFINAPNPDPAQAKFIELTKRYRDAYLKGLSQAQKDGVVLGVGSDLGGYADASENVRELGMLVLLGMTPMQAITAATSTNAAIIGVPDVGSLEAGKYADIIVVKGNPAQNLTALEDVSFVMK